MTSTRRVCVTGGAGFIGSHLVDQLIKEGHKVTVIDDLSNGRIENITQHKDNPDFHFEKHDITDQSAIEKVVNDADVVFHEAASISIEQSIKNPRLTESINVGGTINLLEAALKSNVSRFVYASSAAVYGNKKIPARENMPLEPISSYGVSKLTAENYIALYHRLYGMQTVCLRYFNVYGPRQKGDNPYSGVISKFILNLLSNKPLTIYGDGLQSRDFVSVQDIVKANMLAMNAPDVGGSIFNVGTGKNITINELANALAKAADKPHHKTVHARERKGDIRYSCADISKARKTLGYAPDLGLESQLRDLVNSCRLRT